MVVTLALVAAATIRTAHADPAAAPPTPWRLHDATGAPGWLAFGIEHRIRYAYLANDFRAGATGDASALSLRTLVTLAATADPVTVGVELIDARAYAPDDTALNTTIVDTLDLLQAYVAVHRAGLVADGDALDARVGRITLDAGSRRLVARNSHRNTINTFTGVDLQWTSPGKTVARAFAVVPVTRKPSDAAILADNGHAFDAETFDTLLWGAAYGSPALAAGIKLEGLVLGLHERDGDAATRNRQLVTGDVRAVRKPAAGAVDGQLEVAVQLGHDRASTADTDTTDLSHRAYLVHLEVGRTFVAPWAPRAIAQLDRSSGDADPADDVDGRFDTLFGARRFDYGPTGIYGPFANSNLTSPGLRATASPPGDLAIMAAYRLFWLSSARDAWTTAGQRDPSGACSMRSV